MADANHSSSGTLEVEGFTPFAQIPVWVLRSGGKLPSGAVQLYGVIMTYADNTTHAAFPSKPTLAADMGVSESTVGRAIKALEGFGALVVTRRRNKRTGNYYANHYVLRFTDPSQNPLSEPSVTDAPRREVTGDSRTRPTDLTTPTSVSRPTSSSSPVAPSPQAATASDPQQAATEGSRLSPLQELGDEDLKNKLLGLIVRASADWQHYTYVDIPNDLFDCPDSIGVLEESINNLYDDVDRIVGDDICNKGWDERLARLIAQKPDRPRWGAAVWLNTYINWARLQ